VPRLRVFLSSPGDVGQERLIAARVIERLSGEFTGYVELEPILWEHEPLRASDHFQAQIIPPSECDIVVCILWSRLGTRLPAQFQREDGSLYASGTEWEFEDALASFQKTGRPDLMVYKKTAEPQASMADEDALMARLQQKKALDAFIDKWFGSAKSTFRAAFHTFDTPDRFEATLDTHLRRLVQERLPRITGGAAPGPGGAAVRWHRGSPFRGLQAFDVEHAPVFFGRTRAVAAVKDRLQRGAQNGCAFVLVFGMSGSGKSSLVRAGVLPTLTQPGVIDGIGLWRHGIFRPTDAPDDLFFALASGLLEEKTGLPEMAEAGFDARELAALLRQAPDRAVAAVKTHLARAAAAVARKEGLSRPPEARFALVVDQLEEIFTLPKIDDRQREGFVAALSALARSGAVWVLATMRSDFYPRCAELPELAALKEGPAGQYDVLPPTHAEVGQMIRGPARAAGLRFEADPKTGERLDDVLHEAAARDPEALPLLSFTLEQLWERRLGGNFLTLAAYRDLGGLEGALARRAESVYAAQPVAVQAALPGLLRGLVTVGKDGGTVTARRVPMAALAATPERQTLLDAFVTARLLVVDRADDGQTVVRVAHEALLRHWPRLVESIERDREFLLVRDRAAAAAARWREDGRRPESLLPEGKALADAADLLANRRDDLDAELAEFIAASRRHVEGRRRRRLLAVGGVTGAFLACVSGFGAFSFAQWHRSEERGRLALSAVDRLTRVATTRLAEVPGTRPTLRALLEENLPLLDEVGGKRADAERFESVFQMGDLWQVLGDGARAEATYAESLKIAERAHTAAPADPNAALNLAAARARVGDLKLDRGGDPAAALADYEAARALLEGVPPTRLTGDSKLGATVRQRLAALLGRVGEAKLGLEDGAGAQAADEKAVALWRGEVKAAPAGTERDRLTLELARALLKAGKARVTADNTAAEKAMADYAEAETLLNDVARRDPVAKRDLGTFHTYAGDLRFENGDAAGAVAEYGKGAQVLLDAQRKRPDVTTQGYLADVWRRLGAARQATGDLKGALAALNSGIALAQEIAANDPENRTAQEFLALLWHDLSVARGMAGDVPGALAAQEQSKTVDLTVARRDTSPAGRARLAAAWRDLADVRLQRGDKPGALEAAKGALEALQSAPAKPGAAEDAEAARTLADAYDRFAYAALLNRRFDEALGAAEEGLARSPDSLPLRLTRAHALLLSGKTAEAEREYRDHAALKIDGRESFRARAAAQLRELRAQGLDTPDLRRMEAQLNTR
jgi:tetratricopeptide (TPR) repeat protein